MTKSVGFKRENQQAIMKHYYKSLITCNYFNLIPDAFISTFNWHSVSYTNNYDMLKFNNDP